MRIIDTAKENVKVGSSILFSQCNAEVLAAILPGARPLYRPSMRNKNPRSKRSIMKTIKHSYNLCPSHLFVPPTPHPTPASFFTCYCWMQVYVTYCLSKNTRPKFWCCWIREVWKNGTGRIDHHSVYKKHRIVKWWCLPLCKANWSNFFILTK